MSNSESIARSRLSLVRDPLLLGAAGIAGIAALHLRDPHQSTWLLCPFLTLTGYSCPGCGGLRAINLLSNGEWAAAVSSNLLAVVLVPVLVIAWLLWLWRRARGDAQAQLISLSTRAIAIASAVALVFWIARLTPWGSWLAP